MYGKLPIQIDLSAPVATPCLGKVGVIGLPTDFGGGVRQAVEGGALARRGLAHEPDERIARHFGCVGFRFMQVERLDGLKESGSR